MTTAAISHREEFAKVWERADKIDGWLLSVEGSVLFQAAQQAPAGGSLVEIGSFRGRSSTILASTGRPLWCIDPMTLGSGQEDKYSVAVEDVAALEAALEPFDNAVWIRGTANDLTFTERTAIGQVGLLFIDGCHQPPHPIDDFRAIQPQLMPGAYVCFHDYGEYAAVGNAIRELEREGTIERVQITRTLFVGRIVNQPPSECRRVFIGMPYNSHIETVTWDAVISTILNQERIKVTAWKSSSSLLNSSFNECIWRCHRHGDADYFLLLHSDLGIQPGFLDRMVRIAEEHDYDALHAVAAIKNHEGLTSTAVAYSDDPWQQVRRITTKELAKLPEHFDIEVLREVYDADARILLPNTGVLLMRYDEWFKDFPGFSNLDRIERLGPAEWKPRVVPEDWLFGHWAARNGLRVGGCKIPTKHIGKQVYSTGDAWGHEVDPAWKKAQDAKSCVALT